MLLTVEKAMSVFENELKEYKCHKKFSGGVVLHINPVGNTGFYIGTLTAYDKSGLKSEQAIPFQKFIKVINQLENLLSQYQTTSFTGRLEGWNPTEKVREFLYEKKVHRLFFLAEDAVLNFMEDYTSKKYIAYRLENDVDVLVMFG